MGLVRTRGCAPGGSDLCQVRAICRVLHPQVTILELRGERCEIRLLGVVGAVLTVDPGLVVETGPGGVARRQN